MPGKTPMWGNPTREREILFIASGKYITVAYSQLSAKKKYFTETNVPENLCLEKCAQIRTVVRPPQKKFLEKRAQQCVVRLAQCGPIARKDTKKLLRFSCQKVASKIVPLLVVRTVQIRTIQPSNRKSRQHTQKNCLGICALLFLGNVPTELLTFLSQALSENLSQSPSLVVSCTLPKAKI
jgi:hypothetical protein